MSKPPSFALPRASRGHWLSRRLGRRIVALFLGLLLVVQALSFLVTRESIDRNARADIARSLEVGEKIFRRLLAQHAERQSDGASLLAADQVFSDLQDMSGLRAGLLVRPRPGGTWTLVADTLDEATARSLSISLDASAEPATYTLTLAGREYVVRRLVMDPNQGGNMQAVLLRAVEEAVAPYQQLQLSLAVLTLAGVAVFAVGSVLTARHVTTPINALVSAADRLGRGDYETPVDVRSHDEIGELAQAFDRMRRNVDAQKSQIALLAYWDQLTGLPNRTQFRDAVRDAITQAASGIDLDVHDDETPANDLCSPVAVLMLDLDRFKNVNDVLGYEVGDHLLLQVSERLARIATRSGDMVARLGGDEFAMLLPDTDATQALQVAARIAAVFEESLVIDEQTVDLGVSVGVAIHPDHSVDADSLMSRAEVAMYTAKRRTAGAMLYNRAFDANSARTLSMLGSLRRAVDHGELRLYLQPRVSIHDARLVGAEALLRWAHPQQGLLPPMEFIPFAEQTGFIRTLTTWVAAESLRTWRRLHGQGLTLLMSINLSTRDLMDQDLPPRLAALLDAQRVPAQALCLEITESAIMDDPQRAQQTLERLSEMGFRLAIDDFGTGYSSLAYLKRLPVNELKIDKSFVLQMSRDSGDAKIVRSTIDLAHNLGLTVVAEGVETPTAWRALAGLACDEAQGHLIGRPMPPAEFSDWAERWKQRDAPALQEARDTMI